jgi:hypothetical protein
MCCCQTLTSCGWLTRCRTLLLCLLRCAEGVHSGIASFDELAVLAVLLLALCSMQLPHLPVHLATVNKYSTVAENHAETPNPCMQGCACKQDCPDPLYPLEHAWHPAVVFSFHVTPSGPVSKVNHIVSIVICVCTAVGWPDITAAAGLHQQTGVLHLLTPADQTTSRNVSHHDAAFRHHILFGSGQTSSHTMCLTHAAGLLSACCL